MFPSLECFHGREPRIHSLQELRGEEHSGELEVPQQYS